MDKNNVENADKTHFMSNVDNGHTLGFCGDRKIKCADFSSGGEKFIPFVRLTGGKDARIIPPFMLFKTLTVTSASETFLVPYRKY